MVSINTNNITVNSDGSVSFAGLSSSIDYQSIIDTTITAKRANAVSIENRITTNTEVVSAYGEFKDLAKTMLADLEVMRGSTSYFANDIWEGKTGYFTSAAADTAGAGYSPSSADALISATVTDDAVSGTHTIIVQQTATSHQVRSGVFTSKSDELGTLGYTGGTFEINGKSITVDTTDSLLDLQDAINAADTGVTATIISASDTEHYLVLVANDSGEANAIDFGTATAASLEFGLTTSDSGAAVVANELQIAKNAILDVDGITGIERSSNEIDDILEGVTLSLFDAEPDTKLTVTIETDLSTIKTQLTSFVENYNALRAFYDDQRSTYDRDITVDSDGDDDPTNDEDYGVLASDSTLRVVMERLSSMVVSNNELLEDGFQSLAQIGININEDYELEIDDDKLDNNLLTNVDAVSKLFKASFTSSDARVRYVSGDTGSQQGTYYLNVAGTDAEGVLTGGNISTAAGAGTASDGTLELGNQTLKVTDGSDAEGLSLLFLGGNSASAATDIEITYTRGIADQLFYYFEDLTETNGTIDTLTTQLTERNEALEDQVSLIDTRLEILRTSMETKYIAMESALLELESLKETIQSYMDSMNSE